MTDSDAAATAMFAAFWRPRLAAAAKTVARQWSLKLLDGRSDYPDSATVGI